MNEGLLIGLGLVFGLLGFSLWFMLKGGSFLQKSFRENLYPVAVPGTQMRLAEHPPFKATVQDLAKANALLIQNAALKGYAASEIRKKLDGLFVHWVSADESLEGKRAVVDPYNRKTTDGKPLLVAGWHSGNVVKVVYLKEDSVESTAYIHELGHVVHELRKKTDYAHADLEMWGPEGVVENTKKSMRST